MPETGINRQVECKLTKPDVADSHPDTRSFNLICNFYKIISL